MADETTDRRVGQYLETASGIFWIKKGPDDTETPCLLCSFACRIVADICLDDGAEQYREYELAIVLKGQVSRIRIPAAKFANFGWVPEKLGAQAYLTAFQLVEKRLREAVPCISGEIPRRTIYRHTGWIRRGDRYVYLHAGGAIGADGLVMDVEVELGKDLQLFNLPAPPSGEDLKVAVTAAVNLFYVAPPRIAAPCWCAIWRAVLDRVDFSLAIVGKTGTFKTELLALMQSFFGAGFTNRTIPGSWSSTVNFLRSQAFMLKDAIFSIDDFVPSASRFDQVKQHREAQAFLRDVGNAAGRGRLNSDAAQRPVQVPRDVFLDLLHVDAAQAALEVAQQVLEAPGEGFLRSRLHVDAQPGVPILGKVREADGRGLDVAQKLLAINFVQDVGQHLAGDALAAADLFTMADPFGVGEVDPVLASLLKYPGHPLFLL